MPLPGSYCLAILEEDNPQKSYFRLKPLLIAEEDHWVPFDGSDRLPRDGCIRIVPDKNESGRFKARMRQSGYFCIVDMRAHPEENDKIRPNKNYRMDEAEPNAFIIYSDVVHEAPENIVAQVIRRELPEDSGRIALEMPAPVTARVVFTFSEEAVPFWTHAPLEDQETGIAFTKMEEQTDPEQLQCFTLSDFGEGSLEVLVARPGKVLYPIAEKEPLPEEPAPAQAAAPAPAEPAAEPAAPAARREQPWIHHDPSVMPRPVDRRLSPEEQNMALQSGINPRKGRCLQEIIDDKWKHSRFDQLGHPVPGTAMGTPAQSPVDRAIDAINEAWLQYSARPCLAKAICRIDGMDKALKNAGTEILREDTDEEIKSLTDQRDAIREEIRTLQEQQASVRAGMEERLRAEQAEELERHQALIRSLELQEEDLREKAEESRRIAEESEQALTMLTDEKLTNRLCEYAVNSRAAEILLRVGRGEFPAEEHTFPAEVPLQENITIGSLAARIISTFNATGFRLSRDEAIDLLACFCLGRSLLISGPVGSGKTPYATLFLTALGLDTAGTVTRWRPHAQDEPFEIPNRADLPVPRVLFADNINLTEGMDARMLSDLEEDIDVRAVCTVQDSLSGVNLNLRTLDHSFFYRLRLENADSMWESPKREAPVPVPVVTEELLARLFTPDEKNVMPQVRTRLMNLRRLLGRYGVYLSRRTLDDLWAYCASVTPYMSLTPPEVFDLAFSRRALPSVLATANMEALHALPSLLAGMPRSLALLREPLPIEI